MFGHESGVGHDRRVANILHAAEIGLVHAYCAVRLCSVFIVLSRPYPKDRFLEDVHRNSDILCSPGRHQIFETDNATGFIDHAVGQGVPGSYADKEKIRGHRYEIFISYYLPRRVSEFWHRPAVWVCTAADIPITDKMCIGAVGLDGGGHGALCPAIVHDRHDTLKTPLLALRNVLLGRTRRSRVPVNSFQYVVRWKTTGRGPY